MRRNIDSPLRESNLKLRLALRAAQIGIWDWALDTNEMQYSPRARTIYGFSPDEPVTLEKVTQATHPDDLPRTSALSSKALDPATRAKQTYEYRIRRADTGEERWVLANGEAIFANADGVQKAVRYLGTLRDITERKSAEDALRRSELRQRLAIDAARLAIWEFQIATETVTASPELNRMFGLDPRAKPTIDDFRRLYLPGEREKVQAAGQQALAEGRNHFETEFRIRWPDGSLHWLLLRAEITFGGDGQPDGAIGVVLDIDARKRQEEQQLLFLRELNHRVKNSLSVVQSIATQSFRDGKADPDALHAFRHRLYALSRANEVLLDHEWRTFSLRALVEQIVEPYRDPDDRIEISGEDVDLPPRMNVPLALVLHELSTNAAKYGSLAVEEGLVRIEWRRTPEGIDFLWTEKGGLEVTSPFRKSFGMRLISEILAVELGTVEFEPRPDGVRCRILIAA